ncbi:MAG: hypothetical protein ACON5B_17225 [Myxococcota bacterium]
MGRWWLVLAAVAVTGCHAKFKKAAPHIDSVGMQVFVNGPPQVMLGKAQADPDSGFLAGLVAAGVNIAQGVKEAELRQVIADAVDIQKVNEALTVGVTDGLGAGPPFAVGESDRRGLLQFEVVWYGMYVPQIGAPGEYSYDIVASVYDVQGKRVYRKRTNCSTGVGAPPAISEALWTINNAKQLKETPPADIQRAFTEVGSWCGLEIARKMRKHAG